MKLIHLLTGKLILPLLERIGQIILLLLEIFVSDNSKGSKPLLVVLVYTLFIESWPRVVETRHDREGPIILLLAMTLLKLLAELSPGDEKRSCGHRGPRQCLLMCKTK